MTVTKSSVATIYITTRAMESKSKVQLAVCRFPTREASEHVVSWSEIACEAKPAMLCTEFFTTQSTCRHKCHVRTFPRHDEIIVAHSVTLERREVYIGLKLNGKEEFALWDTVCEVSLVNSELIKNLKVENSWLRLVSAEYTDIDALGEVVRLQDRKSRFSNRCVSVRLFQKTLLEYIS